jgi:predicted TIM-barrel fold metal-dependent hydrolase
MEMNDMIIVSVDDHLVEPPEVFENHVPAAYRDSAPKLIREPNADFWTYAGKKIRNVAMNAVAGRPLEEYGFEPAKMSGMRRGCWDVHDRIDDMNANGILGSLCFGSFTGMDGSVFLTNPDRVSALVHLQAYNDWHIDEWCAAYPGRFIPVAVLPLWDMDATVAEVKRVRAKGCHAVSVSDNPTVKGLPSIHSDYWKPFFKVCADNDVTICCHIGTGNAPNHTSMDSPIEVWTTTFPMAIAMGAADWLHLPALQELPNLKISLTEGGIGWIPYLLERADYVHWRHHSWTNSDFKGELPSTLFKKHFYTCFIDDKFGLQNRDAIGIDTICYECDYPHSDSVWPESPDLLWKSFDGLNLTDEEINKITHLNAMRAFSYDPFKHIARKDATVGALRAAAKAKGVSTEPTSFGGAERPVEEGVTRVVTSGDVVRLFQTT